MRERERRPELLSSGQEAGCEYLINSHQGSEDLPSCAAGPRHPKASRALRPEQWSMNAPAQSCCDTNREEGPPRTGRTIDSIFFLTLPPNSTISDCYRCLPQFLGHEPL